MAAQETKRCLHRVLVDRILRGPGHAPPEQRARAFENAGLPDAVRPLLDKVATRSAEVTDADFAAATQAGLTDDQLFELVVCAAVGASTRQYEVGLTALAEATGETGATGDLGAR